MPARKHTIFPLLATVALLTQGIAVASAPLEDAGKKAYSPYADRAYPTDVFFGDTHVHTGLSADAGGSGTRLMPRDSYRFASGKQVTSNTGQPVKLARPYDFYMITDHSDGMGAITDILSGTPNVMADETGRMFHEAFNKGGKEAARAQVELVSQFSQGKLPAALNYQPGNPDFARVWQDLIQAAEEFNNPGYFTTFIAYEWTSLVKGNNLHRNVIFRDGQDKAGQVEPYTTSPPLGSPNPRDLWAWMQAYEDKTGGQVTAIPHNGNLSNGMMFALQDDFARGADYDPAYAQTRQKWERLYEAVQLKGDGETHPLLSNEDEFADYERWDWGNLDASEAKTPAMLPGEYVRSGLLRGLQLQGRLGTNPFKFGLVGGTDTHTGLSTVDDDNFFGKFPIYEPGPARATHLAKNNEKLGISYKGWRYSSAGMAAVWAQENTRESIFDAMQRRETYATTGPRMRVRFFAGWDFSDEDLKRRDLARAGYSKGVPMGADLTRPAGESKAPAFLVYAQRDPMGANLDRIQVIKGWLDRKGESHEQVYDVAWSGDRQRGKDGKLPPVGDTVDLAIPAWTNSIGAADLGAVWRDPDFDPTLQAFYYARVIEIPTPRWTAYDKVRFGMELPPEIPLKVQERAYTSPIWYQAQ